MNSILAFYKSSVGKKVVTAATGVVLFAFVAVHMLGNLQVFAGQKTLDHYAELLQSKRALLWGVRGFMSLVLALHVLTALQLWLKNTVGRPHGYVRYEPVEATWFSRTMIITGPLILLFLVYHLLHYTTGTLHPAFEHGKVFHNLMVGFASGAAAGIYLAATAALGVHLYHGLWSMLQTFGLSHPKYDAARRILASLAAAVLVVGNSVIVISVFVAGQSH